jgi:2-keto-4-pentenoate hydratase
MMDSETIARAAEIYAKAKINRSPINSLDEQYIPRDEALGYVIQNKMLEICEAGGMGPVKGYKVGLVNPEMRAIWAQSLGFDSPCYGGIPEKLVHIGTADIAYPDDVVRLGIEGEFAVRIAKDIPPEAAPFDRESIQEYVGACCAGIEIVEWVYDYYNESVGAPNGPLMIAEGGVNGGGIFSEGVADWHRLDLESLRGVLVHDGKEVASGYARDLQGHPFNVLAWAAGHMIKHGRTLHAGDRVLLGSVLTDIPMYDQFGKGAEMVMRWDQIGEVKVNFT